MEKPFYRKFLLKKFFSIMLIQKGGPFGARLFFVTKPVELVAGLVEKIFTRITACYNINSMKTGKIALALLAFALLASCSKGDQEQKSSSEIMKDYTKTLSTAPEKAEKAADAAEQRDSKMTDAIKELDK